MKFIFTVENKIVSEYKFKLLNFDFAIPNYNELVVPPWIDVNIAYDDSREVVNKSYLHFLHMNIIRPVPTKFIKWANLFALWDKTVEQSNMNKMEACIQFSSSFNEIDKVIFGIDNVEQFKEVSEYNFQSKYNNLCDMSSNDEYLINPTKWSLL